MSRSFFLEKEKKKKFRKSYRYFEAKSESFRNAKEAIVGGARPRRRLHIQRGCLAGRVGGRKSRQFHCAVNNDISEGTGGYRNFGSPLGCGNDRTHRWTPLSLSLSTRFYLPFRSLLCVHHPIDLNLPVLFVNLFNEIFEYFCRRGKIKIDDSEILQWETICSIWTYEDCVINWVIIFLRLFMQFIKSL